MTGAPFAPVAGFAVGVLEALGAEDEAGRALVGATAEGSATGPFPTPWGWLLAAGSAVTGMVGAEGAAEGLADGTSPADDDATGLLPAGATGPAGPRREAT